MSDQVLKGIDSPTSEAARDQPAPPGPEDIESLRARLEAAEKQRDELLALLQTTRAEFENYQKRAQRDAAEERRYAPANLASELLPALDNLQRAVEAAQKPGEAGALIQGVAMVRTQLLDVLRRFGITPIDALGQTFDPAWHEAVMQRPWPGVAPGTIVQVLEPGYRIHERVLRPARVVVAAAPTAER